MWIDRWKDDFREVGTEYEPIPWCENDEEQTNFLNGILKRLCQIGKSICRCPQHNQWLDFGLKETSFTEPFFDVRKQRNCCVIRWVRSNSLISTIATIDVLAGVLILAETAFSLLPNDRFLLLTVESYTKQLIYLQVFNCVNT